MNAKNMTIGLCIGLFIASFFVATQPINPRMAIVSSIFVVLFALPSYIGVVRTLGKRSGVALLAVLGLYALTVETSAIHTGFPYGSFVYTEVLGRKILGLTPWTIAFAYPPILLLAYWFARRHTKNIVGIIALTAFGAMAIDLVLDPAAVALGFWYWHRPGFFYGVPLVNFLGWLLSSAIGASIIHLFWKKHPVPSIVAYSGLIITFFWCGVNIWLQNWVSVIVGVVILSIVLRGMGISPYNRAHEA